MIITMNNEGRSVVDEVDEVRRVTRYLSNSGNDRPLADKVRGIELVLRARRVMDFRALIELEGDAQ